MAGEKKQSITEVHSQIAKRYGIEHLLKQTSQQTEIMIYAEYKRAHTQKRTGDKATLQSPFI
jgi:hypothetical protein